jgi:SAM-dependent methyltransferase
VITTASSAVVFDGLAAGYDANFGAGRIDTLVRHAVWRRLEASFPPGGRVLDLGCGTGEDAAHLAESGMRVVAIDASQGMVARARSKAEERGVAARVVVHSLPVERLDELPEAGPFDGVLSNFGVLNCVADLGVLARGVARRVRPGARVALCVMGPLVPWEWAWHLARGQPRKAFRRLRPGGALWRGLRILYPTPSAVARAFAPFRVTRTSALGALLPPPYAEEWAARHPRLLGTLARWERRLEAVPPLPWLADHFLVELVVP